MTSSQFPVLSSQTEQWSPRPSSASETRRFGLAKLDLVWPDKFRGLLIRWLKFNFVGGIGIVVQLAALAALRSAFHVNYLVATVVAVEIAVLHNFYWHERFTWADRRRNGLAISLGRLARFNLSNGAVSLAGNLVLMRLLVGHFHVHYIVANLVAIAVCSIANFVLSDQLVFPHLSKSHARARNKAVPVNP